MAPWQLIAHAAPPPAPLPPDPLPPTPPLEVALAEDEVDDDALEDELLEPLQPMHGPNAVPAVLHTWTPSPPPTHGHADCAPGVQPAGFDGAALPLHARTAATRSAKIKPKRARAMRLR
jgi:hypothetical protein